MAFSLPRAFQSLPGAALEEVSGFIGGFDAILASDDGQSVERVGYVIAAPPAENIPKYADYGLSRSEKVISISELEGILENQGPLFKSAADWYHVVFLCGLEGESDPNTFERVFDAIEKLRASFPVQPYIFTRQVKVAADGLERRYRQIRDEGALFFKFDGEGPTFEEAAGGLTMLFADPILGIELELVPDLLVVDEDHRPPSSLEPLLKVIPSSVVTAPFLQPESTRFSGVKTPKAGIFALGPARGNFSPESAATDIEAALLELKIPVNENPAGLPGPPVVDEAKCTICLTCVRLCPHGAMGFRKRAEADPASCVRCGICAVECPMEAITLAPPAGQAEFGDKIVTGLSATANTSKIVAFLCSRSAARAMAAAGPKIGKRFDPHNGSVRGDHRSIPHPYSFPTRSGWCPCGRLPHRKLRIDLRDCPRGRKDLPCRPDPGRGRNRPVPPDVHDIGEQYSGRFRAGSAGA